MEQIPKLDFETLDTILGDHAPFLISMPDWLQEELRLVIAAAEASSVNGHIPELNGSDEATKQALHTMSNSSKWDGPRKCGQQSEIQGDGIYNAMRGFL